MGNLNLDGKATAMTASLHRATLAFSLIIQTTPKHHIVSYLHQSKFLLLQVFKMADRVKEVAVEEVVNIKTQTIQAARSAAYLYPLQACYFPSCWRIA